MDWRLGEAQVARILEPRILGGCDYVWGLCRLSFVTLFCIGAFLVWYAQEVIEICGLGGWEWRLEV